jgi:membrane-associated phospholipid phosphatase
MSVDIDPVAAEEQSSDRTVTDADGHVSVGAARRSISELVSRDPFFWFRALAMTAYGATYVWWFRSRGLLIDRISVALSVAIFLACAFAGKPWRRWLLLLVDAALYALMWFGYEMTRGAADHLGLPLQVQSVRNIDRFLFFGHDPNVWMQQHFYEAGHVRWYDDVASSVYYTHFVFPVVALAVLWAASRVQWVRFLKRFATVLAAGCVGFVLLPTAPPWMASSLKYRYRLFAPLARHTGRGFTDMGFKGFVKGWQHALDWGNVVAAMPSLHSAFSLFVPAFFLPWLKPKWLKALVLVFPVLMLASLVYFGEHWVIDGLVGWLLVGCSFLFWNRIERRGRRRRADDARRALRVRLADYDFRMMNETVRLGPVQRTRPDLAGAP